MSATTKYSFKGTAQVVEENRCFDDSDSLFVQDKYSLSYSWLVVRGVAFFMLQVLLALEMYSLNS